MDKRRLPPGKRLSPRHWVAIDYAVTVLMLLLYLASRVLAISDGVPRWVSVAAVAVAVLPAALRRRWPRGVLALVAVGSAVATAITAYPVPALAPAFVMYLIPLRFPRRDALWLLAGTLLVTAAGLAGFIVIRHGSYGRGGAGEAGLFLLESSLLIALAWLAGYSVRQHRAFKASERRQKEQQAREQLAQARRANSEERLRIARELHDVVAHSLTLITVQAGIANYVVGQRPEETSQVLSSIEEISRGALTEMRALLGVLRAEEPGAGASPPRQETTLGPAPGLADLASLAERTAAAAGLRVDLDVPGTLPPLSAGLELAAYRVIQEAVTNVIKHAAADQCTVRVAWLRDTLTVEITDDGGGTQRSLQGSQQTGQGHGIEGMRERAGMYGGELHAAPLPGRGFRVTARFPLAVAVP